jgi:hypothetical protein
MNEPQIFNRVNWGDNKKSDKIQRTLYTKNLKEWSEAKKLKLRNEGRDFFKKELLLDIERQEKRGWEFREIYDNIKNLLRN